MKVALTFDDGPSEWTGPILDLLAEHDAKATFFVCGAHILGNVALIDRIKAEGHELGNHTTNHPNLRTMSEADVRREIAETQAMIHAITGELPVLWRAPYLALPHPTPEWPTHLGADVIPEDWRISNPDLIARHILESADNESVVLLHDGRPVNQPSFADGGSLDTRESTVEAVRCLLERADGWEFVTASSLLAAAV